MLSHNKQKHILVTGGSGFLGGRLVSKLSKYKSYSVVSGSRKPQPGLAKAHNVGWSRLDLSDNASIERACKGVDVLIHLAGLDASTCAALPKTAFNINTIGTAKILEAAGKCGVSQFIYISTAHVYGENLRSLVNENSATINPSIYGSSHLAAEHVAFQASKKNMMNVTCLRLSNGFGVPAFPETNCWSLLINSFCKEAAETGKITIYSPIDFERNFVSVSHFESVVLRLINCEGRQQNFNVVNIGGRFSLSLSQLASKVSKSFSDTQGRKIKVKYNSEDFVHQTSSLKYQSLVCQNFDIKPEKEVTFDRELNSLINYCLL
jgi:UDP-glucose 4-epimerase